MSLTPLLFVNVLRFYFYDFFDNFACYVGLTHKTLDPVLSDDLYWVMAASEKGCCVPSCGKTRKDQTVLHTFPNPDQDMDQYLAWTRSVGIDKLALDPHYVYKNRRVCHDHFELKFLTCTRRLCPGAVPTLLLSGKVNIHHLILLYY